MVTNLLLTASLLSSVPTKWNSNVAVRFRVVDDAGLIVSNAVITTNTQRDRLANLGHAGSPQRKIIAITDMNGCARIEFPCYSGEFSSQVSGERIYSEHKKDVLFKYARDSVYFAHLLEHEKDLSFTVRKKVNPIPMFCNRTGYYLKVPNGNGRFGFDIKENDWVHPYGRGKIQDFQIDYCCSLTNGNKRIEGSILFPGDGCGAYKLKKMPFGFCSVYNADTNAVYNQRFDFVREITPTNFIEKTDVLCDDEYLVLRTRVKKDTQGVIVSANYSKIYGMFAIDRILYFRESFFNPTPNDPNLEYNGENLAPRRR